MNSPTEKPATNDFVVEALFALLDNDYSEAEAQRDYELWLSGAFN